MLECSCHRTASAACFLMMPNAFGAEDGHMYAAAGIGCCQAARWLVRQNNPQQQPGRLSAGRLPADAMVLRCQ